MKILYKNVHIRSCTNKQTNTHAHTCMERGKGIASTKMKLPRQKTEDIKRQLNYKGQSTNVKLKGCDN